MALKSDRWGAFSNPFFIKSLRITDLHEKKGIMEKWNIGMMAKE
jgi:hypothetical protein